MLKIILVFLFISNPQTILASECAHESRPKKRVKLSEQNDSLPDLQSVNEQNRLDILSYLQYTDLSKLALVNKSFKESSESKVLKKLSCAGLSYDDNGQTRYFFIHEKLRGKDPIENFIDFNCVEKLIAHHPDIFLDFTRRFFEHKKPEDLNYAKYAAQRYALYLSKLKYPINQPTDIYESFAGILIELHIWDQIWDQICDVISNLLEKEDDYRFYTDINETIYAPIEDVWIKTFYNASLADKIGEIVSDEFEDRLNMETLEFNYDSVLTEVKNLAIELFMFNQVNFFQLRYSPIYLELFEETLTNVRKISIEEINHLLRPIFEFQNHLASPQDIHLLWIFSSHLID